MSDGRRKDLARSEREARQAVVKFAKPSVPVGRFGGDRKNEERQKEALRRRGAKP